MIGEIIQQKRKEVGLTQAQLADRLGVTPPAVNRWEKNLSFPDATLLAPLARLLKTDMNTLFSFYDTLSDMERESTVDEARMTFLKGGEQDGLSFIDKVIKKNLADGILYKKLGDMLHGIHIFQKPNAPRKHLDRIAAYYERAIELSPEFTEELSHSLITVYAGMGDAEKAEAAWARLPKRNYGKSWAHAEMQFLLKNNEAAVKEVKECVLRETIELITHMNFLKDVFLQNGDDTLSDLAKEKTLELIDLFTLWKGLAVFCDVTKSVTTSDGDSMFKNLSAFVEETPIHKNLSGSPLFEDVVLGGMDRKDASVADAMADLYYSLNKKHCQKQV